MCQCRQEVADALENPEGLGTMFPMSGGEADGRGSIVPTPRDFLVRRQPPDGIGIVIK